jgi:hypothetical protein
VLTILFNRGATHQPILDQVHQSAPAATAPADKPAEGQKPAEPAGSVLDRLNTKPAEPPK